MDRRESKSLGVLQTTQYIVERSKLVRVDMQRLKAACHELRNTVWWPAWNYKYHFFDGTKKAANYAFLLDALNFCFWPQPRWKIEYLGEALEGYWALAASLKRAVEEGSPILDANYLADIPAEDVAFIFRGENEIPLLEQRIKCLREVGRVLNEHYQGLFANIIKLAKQDAVCLVRTIVDKFPSFRDETFYEQKRVLFYKRAQVLVADLYWMFHGQSYGRFYNMHELTAFADYKLPQILRHMGILEYKGSLREKIDHGQQIDGGSDEEAELRAVTIWVVEWMRQVWVKLGLCLSNYQIDSFLWTKAENLSDAIPYHRTLTIFY